MPFLEERGLSPPLPPLHWPAVKTMASMSDEQASTPELSSLSWYHGLLPREDIKQFLHETGDFLVRMSEPSSPGKRELVLSVMFDKEKDTIKHFVINRDVVGLFSIEKQKFKSVPELVKFFLDNKSSLSAAREVIIRNPIGRLPWELSHADVQSKGKLGEGAFGEVHRGTWRSPKGKSLPVAIKVAKLDALTKEQIKEIMREARLMRHFDHPNVVRLYGVAAAKEPLMIASNGALDSYLKNNNCSMERKMEMIMQAAWGVEYLHTKDTLHRDIAARNCLYGDGKVKISDFGLSRPGVMYQMDPKMRVPIRWLSPETLRSAIYTQKTDVWSYGILCWEILHNGSEPYPGLSVAEMSIQVKGGHRMTLSDLNLPKELETLISQRCWNENPNERYFMNEMTRTLEKMTRLPRPETVVAPSRIGGSSRKMKRKKSSSSFK